MKKLVKTELALPYILSRMSSRGIRVNMPEALKQSSKCEELIKEAEEFLSVYAGNQFVDSHKHIQQVFDNKGWAYKSSMKGNASFSKKVITDYYNVDPEYIKNLMDHRRYSKLLNTYYKEILHLAIHHSGCVHPSYQQNGAVTGRMSAWDPAIQTIPSTEDVDEGLNVRRCFIPRHGYKLMAFDYSQQEYRLLLDYLNIPSLTGKMNRGGDFHEETADMLGVSRKLAKNVNFGLLYGAGNKTISSIAGVSEAEASNVRKRIAEVIPELPKFIRAVTHAARKKGYIKNWAGRVVRVPKDKPYKGINYLIQSGGADIVKRAMVVLDDYIKDKDIYMVCQIHDELIFEVGEDIAHCDTADIIARDMEKQYDTRYGVLMKVDAQMGDSFAKEDLKDI